MRFKQKNTNTIERNVKHINVVINITLVNLTQFNTMKNSFNGRFRQVDV